MRRQVLGLAQIRPEFKDKDIYAIHNTGAKSKTKSAKDNRKYTILTIGGRDYAYDLCNITKRLELKLNGITRNKRKIRGCSRSQTSLPKY